MNSKIFLSVFISLIMISSILGYMFVEREQSIKYKGYKFVNINENWVADVNKEKVFVSERPDLLTNISTPDLSLGYLNSMDKIYLSLNPEEKLSSSLYLFSLNILSKLKTKLIEACIEDSEECKDLPLKTCDDATDRAFVIIIKRGSGNYKYENNCLTIIGDNEYALRYLDKLALDLLI